MGVAQKSGEHRQTLFDINTRTVPMNKCGHRKSMAKVMQAWTESISVLSQAGLVRQLDESITDHAVGQSSALI